MWWNYLSIPKLHHFIYQVWNDVFDKIGMRKYPKKCVQLYCLPVMHIDGGKCHICKVLVLVMSISDPYGVSCDVIPGHTRSYVGLNTCCSTTKALRTYFMSSLIWHQLIIDVKCRILATDISKVWKYLVYPLLEKTLELDFTHKIRPISRPSGRAMGCLLWGDPSRSSCPKCLWLSRDTVYAWGPRLYVLYRKWVISDFFVSILGTVYYVEQTKSIQI